MNKLKAIIALLTGNIIKDIGDAFDKNFTSKEEKEQALIEKEKVYNERLKIIAEMESGENASWLRENIRPLVFLIGFISVTVMLFVPVQIDPGIKKTYMGWMALMMSTYFIRREYLKAKDRKNGK